MPFQGNPNAGAPDPAILQFVAQRQKDRAAQQRQQQIDQMNAIQAAREEARAQQQFDIDMAIKNQQLMQERANTADKIQGLLGSVGTRAEAVPEEQRQAAQSSQFFGSVGDGDQQLGQDFAATVLPLDPNVFNEEMALASTLTGDRILDQDIDAVARMRGVSRSDVLGGAGTQLNVGRIAEQKELDKTIAAEQRQEEKERRAREEAAAIAERQAQRNFQRDISKTGAEVIQLQNQIEEQQRTLATAPIGSPEFARAQKREALLQSAMSKKLTEGVDPGHLTNIQKWMDENVSLVQETETAIADVGAFLSLAEQNPNFLGTTRGGLSQYIANAFEGARDIADVSGAAPLGSLANLSEATFNAFAKDPTLSAPERDRLGRDLGFESNNVLQARNDVKSVSARIAYIVTKGNNPGRFSIKEYEQNLSRFRADKGTAAQALRNLRTGLAEMEGVASRVKNRVSAYERVSPGLAGGLVGSEGEVVLPPSDPTPFASLTGQQSEPPSGVPNVTFGRSGLPLLSTPAAPRASAPGGVSANDYLNLSVEERAAYLEKLLKENR